MEDYVVMRPGPGLPEGFLPSELDGRWYNKSGMPFKSWTPSGLTTPTGCDAVAVPTMRFEMREDGAVAQVYEFRV